MAGQSWQAPQAAGGKLLAKSILIRRREALGVAYAARPTPQPGPAMGMATSDRERQEKATVPFSTFAHNSQ